MVRSRIFLTISIFIIAACTGRIEEIKPLSTDITTFAPTATSIPVIKITPQKPQPSQTLFSTPLIAPTSSIPAGPIYPTPTHSPIGNSPVPPNRLQITADHTAIDQFEIIPDSAITDAKEIRLLLRGSSIAWNMDIGLNCLSDTSSERRMYGCSDFSDARYDRSNWVIQLRGNPGWIDKVKDFVENTQVHVDQYDAFLFLVDYVDGQDQVNYPQISDDDNFQELYIEPREALETQYPEKIFIWTTMTLEQGGFSNGNQFNQMLRDYAVRHNKILFDLADIESHNPDGDQCTNELGYQIICPDYTNEAQGGHLNGLGAERTAKALWWLMARIRGWDGESR